MQTACLCFCLRMCQTKSMYTNCLEHQDILSLCQRKCMYRYAHCLEHQEISLQVFAPKNVPQKVNVHKLPGIPTDPSASHCAKRKYPVHAWKVKLLEH